MVAVSVHAWSEELAPFSPKLAFKCEAYEAFGITSNGNTHELSKFNQKQGSVFLVHHSYWPLEGKRWAVPREAREDLSEEEVEKIWLEQNYEIEMRNSYLTSEKNSYLVRRGNHNPKEYDSGNPSDCFAGTYRRESVTKEIEFYVSCQSSGQAFTFDAVSKRYKLTTGLAAWPFELKEEVGGVEKEVDEQQVTYFGYCEEYYP